MKESIAIQFQFDVKYHEAVMALIVSVNEKECEATAFISEGSYTTYDSVERKLLFHLFEFVWLNFPKEEYPRPENLFDRFAQATNGTGIASCVNIRR